MKKADAAKLVAIVTAAYPNFDKFRNADAVRATVDLWATMFEEDDGAVVGLAVKKHIATSVWPPSVAEIREIMLEMIAPHLIAPDAAWKAVSDLLHTVGQFNHGVLHDQLPAMVADTVEAIGWMQLWELYRACSIGGKAGADRAAFLQMYTPRYEREKRRLMTPPTITMQIGIRAHAGEYLPGETGTPEGILPEGGGKHADSFGRDGRDDWETDEKAAAVARDFRAVHPQR